MRERAATFDSSLLPYLLVAPQVIITLIFFIWPASQAVYQSLFVEDAFGLSVEFVWFENYTDLFHDEKYIESISITVLFSIGVVAVSMLAALLLAFCVEHIVRGVGFFKTMLIWPYAVAPAVAGVLWVFLFNPSIGLYSEWLDLIGYEWNHLLDGNDAMVMVIVASAWRQISYNFLFFVAAMQAIPRSLIEAAAIDGSGPLKRFRDITLPLLGPVTFFLIVVNIIYAFFDTFGVVHATTDGGPAGATSILVFKSYQDGFIGQDFGSSSAQSVVLMVIVSALTFIQFRYIERRVHYG